MPQDGTVIASIANELTQQILGGRIDKITQPEADEVIISIRSGGTNHKLLLTAQSTAPRLHLTAQSKQSPMQAPNFCMVLRKHLNSGRIVDIRQPGFERIVEIHIEALNEMGDKGTKILLIEIMGKHSNIMLVSPTVGEASSQAESMAAGASQSTDESASARIPLSAVESAVPPCTKINSGKIIDAIKHVPPSVSSVRAILPGVVYNRPPSDKSNPLEANQESFYRALFQSPVHDALCDAEHPNTSQQARETQSLPALQIQTALYKCYSGLSPILASEICARANIPPDAIASELDEQQQTRLFGAFLHVFDQVRAGNFTPSIHYDDNTPASPANTATTQYNTPASPSNIATSHGDTVPLPGNTAKAIDLTAWPFEIYAHLHHETYGSPSALQESYYAKRGNQQRVGQKTADLRKLVTNLQERCHKKTIMFEKTMASIQNRDELRIKGEILTAYLHQVEPGAESVILENFYDENAPITIPLSPLLSPTENAQRYFKQYNKQKRTEAALQEQIAQNNEDLAYLDSVALAMETVVTEADIAEIRAELAEGGFVKRKYAAATQTRDIAQKYPGTPGRHSQKRSAPNKNGAPASGKKGDNRKGSGVSKPLRYTSADGYEIYVGKNNTQNDYLTLRQAKNHDIWLHTKDIAGSHVIIITGGTPPPETTILEAANIAAYYSKGRNSSQVPVDYVQCKYVRKPSGAKPGFVIYDRHRTVYVSPVEPK